MNHIIQLHNLRSFAGKTASKKDGDGDSNQSEQLESHPLECEAKGLALAAHILHNQAGNEDPEALHGLLEQLAGMGDEAHPDGDDKRSYASPDPDLVLEQSKKNPRVRRWIRRRAREYVNTPSRIKGEAIGQAAKSTTAGAIVGSNVGVKGAAIGAGVGAGIGAVQMIHHLHANKELSNPEPDSPIHHEYWQKKGKWIIDRASKEHDLEPDTIAHAMAYMSQKYHNHPDYKGDHREITRKVTGDFLSGVHQMKQRDALVAEGRKTLASLDSKQVRKIKQRGDRVADSVHNLLDAFGVDVNQSRTKKEAISMALDELMDALSGSEPEDNKKSSKVKQATEVKPQALGKGE